MSYKTARLFPRIGLTSVPLQVTYCSCFMFWTLVNNPSDALKIDCFVEIGSVVPADSGEYMAFDFVLCNIVWHSTGAVYTVKMLKPTVMLIVMHLPSTVKTRQKKGDWNGRLSLGLDPPKVIWESESFYWLFYKSLFPLSTTTAFPGRKPNRQICGFYTTSLCWICSAGRKCEVLHSD